MADQFRTKETPEKGRQETRLTDLIERDGEAVQVRVSADGLRIPLLDSSKVVLDNLGGARVAIVKRANTVRVEAAVPELAEIVRWSFEVGGHKDLREDEPDPFEAYGAESIRGSAPRSVEEMIYDYRVALAGRL